VREGLRLTFTVAALGLLGSIIGTIASHPRGAPWLPSQSAADHRGKTNEATYTADRNQTGTHEPAATDYIQINTAPRSSVGCCHDEKTKEEPMRLTDILLVVVGLLQFGGLIGGIAVYFMQAKIMRQTFLWGHRPKIRVKHVWLTSDIWHGEPVEVAMVITNIGTAPAKIAQINFATLVLRATRELPFPPDPKPPFRSLSMDVLDCGISSEITKATDLRVLSPEDHVGIRKQERFLYCWGQIEYHPVGTSGVHTTAFCRKLHLRDQANVADRGRFRVHHDADYEYQD